MKRQMNQFEHVIFRMIGKLGNEIEDKKQQRFEGGPENKVLTAEIEILSRILIDLQFDMIANVYESNE